MAMKTWTPLEKTLVGGALLTTWAIALTYLQDGKMSTFLTYLVSMLLFSGFALLLVGAYRHFGRNSTPERGDGRFTRAQAAMLAAIVACAVYAAIQASLSNGGYAVAFIVVFVMCLLALSAVVLAVTVTRRLVTR